ncbi:M61 glycyl aminopeptidase [Posidoniimonas polymericola]|uniref:M61 glycyl aminopeptidase n=1 Tax=Posidoniimonas polymericola TaxID=2528002 RepID=A0A5C5YR01_9BACT|nr:hypothetical protein [Posidoniimonas polymericola]TWT77293.1 M61 glycyl aminopeptidase [Posidoniimonas polymericola]
MNSRLATLATLVLLLDVGHASAEIELSIDATRAPQGLLASEVVLPAKPGENYFWHPNWLPGVSGATEQISNVVGLVFEDASGERLPWRRDPKRANLFCVTVPAGADSVRARMQYVMNHPDRLSSAVDCYGSESLLVLNFNCCLLYPDVPHPGDLDYRLHLGLPNGLQHACALRAEKNEAGSLDFQRTPLQRLIDSPLVAGSHFKELTFTSDAAPAARVCLFSDSADGTAIGASRERQLGRILPQAERLFGGAPFPSYMFLVVCTDQTPRFGLEHRECSLMTLRPEALVDNQLFSYRPAYLLPHELAHAWCGKLRTPEGMLSDDFHSPFDTELLWVYEGLTQYLMQLIAVRSGQVDFRHHLGYLADRVADQARREGRVWRSLADTAIAARTLRGQDHEYRDLRRAQDYYDEGALFWLRVDCALRDSTNGEASLDDFCRAFFRVGSERGPRGFDVDEIVATLDSLSPGPWRGLINRLIYQPQGTLDLAVLEMAGYRLATTPVKPSHLDAYEAVWGFASAERSIGLIADKHGTIKHLLRGGAADDAGLTLKSQVVAVNGRDYSRSRLHKAIAASDSDQPIELIVKDGRGYAARQIDYTGGARFPTLERDPARPDLLRVILTPLPASPQQRQPVAGEASEGFDKLF